MATTLSSLTNSQRLRYKIDIVLPEMIATSRVLWKHLEVAALYPDYLFTTYSMVRATVPLMERAREQSLALQHDDPVAAALAPYLEKHIPEERHAHWTLEDLEALGYPRGDILRRTPPPTVAAMVGAQYYWIFHRHPVALLGYMVIMECYPPTADQIDSIIAATRFPQSAFRTLSRHAKLDLHHRQELEEVIDALPLPPWQIELIGVSALQTLELGSRAIREIVERHQSEHVYP
jgi:hypothetical protein